MNSRNVSPQSDEDPGLSAVERENDEETDIRAERFSWNTNACLWRACTKRLLASRATGDSRQNDFAKSEAKTKSGRPRHLSAHATAMYLRFSQLVTKEENGRMGITRVGRK